MTIETDALAPKALTADPDRCAPAGEGVRADGEAGAPVESSARPHSEATPPGQAAPAAVLLADHLRRLADERRASPATIAAYAQDLTAYLEFLVGHFGGPVTGAELATLRAGDVRAYLHTRRTGPAALSDRSVARALSAIRGFHRHLQRRCGIPGDPLAGVRGPRVPVSLPRPVSEAGAADLIAAAAAQPAPPWIAARDAALLTLIYAAGLRISEALALTGADRPLPEALRVAGKGGKTRIAPILPAAREAVEAYAALCPHPLTRAGPLFRAVRGGPMSPRTAQAMVAALRGALGLPDSATPHALRHAFATHLLAHGADLRAIQELLGHAALSATQVYAAVENQQALAVFARAHPRADPAQTQGPQGKNST